VRKADVADGAKQAHSVRPVDTQSFLSAWRGSAKRPSFVVNPGNAGDAAIASATMQMFRRLGIRPKLIKARSVCKNSIVILGGGGNLVPLYRHTADALKACVMADVSRCLLLPHTIRGHEDTLALLDRRFTILCRDRPSYDHVRAFAPRAKAMVARDVVLELDVVELQRHVSSWQHKISMLADLRWLKRGGRWRCSLSFNAPDASGTLHIYRAGLGGHFANHAQP